MKMTDVPTDQLGFYRDDLQSKVFEIFAIAHNSIEARFMGEYITVADMIRELDKEGWEFKEMGKVIIDIPGYRKTLSE
jgi:nuclear transport factor 2 (NTF2) superfamily protein